MNNYDIIVFGGGAAGCAAAYTAGKLGFKTLLLEKQGVLGGSMTAGLVVPAMKSSENQINTEFYSDLISEMKKFNSQITYQNNPGWFNPEILKIALDNLMSKAGVDVLFNTTVLRINLSGRILTDIVISSTLLSEHIYTIYSDNNNILSERIGARYFVDATGNSEIFKNLNCNFLENKDETQPFSLRFIMSGINLDVFSKWLLDFDKDREVTTVENVANSVHLSTAYTWDAGREWALAPLFNDAVNKKILKDTDRNYFQVFTIPNMPSSLAFNCPRIVSADGSINIRNISKALLDARQAVYRLSNFCKEYFPGFENSYISNISDILGIRTSRRIKGKYLYTMNDIITGKKFDNPVAIADYPIDVHSKDKNSSTLKAVQDYQIPVEALMSADYDNLFAAGRNISADFMAQGAIRIQPTCFSMGEGLVKYIFKNLNS